MIRKQVYLTEEANEKLIQLAKDRNTTQAELIREGIESYLLTIEEQKKNEGWKQLLDKMRASTMSFDHWDREEIYAELYQTSKEVD